MPTGTFIAYTLLFVGMPIFVGMFVGSFIAIPVSKALRPISTLERIRLQIPEAVSGLVAAVSGVFLFRLFGLTANLMVLGIMGGWISIYCRISHDHVPNWLSWLGGLALGWVAFEKIIPHRSCSTGGSCKLWRCQLPVNP